MPNATRTNHSPGYFRCVRGFIGCSGLLVLLFATFHCAEAGPLTKAEQALVDRAIDGGVGYLKRSQGTSGSWAGPKEKHQLGYAVLPGLALLECGVPANAQVIRRVAASVRRSAPNLVGTYELALCILFLDRLGDPKDRELIQTFAARLIAGQAESGGWTYACPLVNKKTREEILTLLRKLDPPEPMEAIAVKNREPLADTPARLKPANPPLEGTPTNKAPSLEGSTTGKPSPSSPSGGVPELPEPAPLKKKPAVADKPVKPAESDDPIVVPRHLKNLPIFRDKIEPPPRAGRRRVKIEVASTTDNSNTQFALLALWVAQRYDVPARRTLIGISRRFENSQIEDGSWGYHYLPVVGETGEPAMTCVGLLGLAVGHGIARQPRDGTEPKPIADPRIVNGLKALSKTVGKPTGAWQNLPMENTYYLWSVERVGVLYGLPTVGDREWYRWGAEILVANQRPHGFWNSTHYPGNSPTIDTCMALLFLKRANFVADLTKKLRFKPEDLNATIMRTAPSPGESLNTEKPR